MRTVCCFIWEFEDWLTPDFPHRNFPQICIEMWPHFNNWSRGYRVFFWQIQPYRCLQVRGDYSWSTFQRLKFCYVGCYNRNINSDLEGQQFRYSTAIDFLSEPPLKSSPNVKKWLPSFKRGATYLLRPTHKPWSHYFVNFLWEALQFEATMPQLCTFHVDLHPQARIQL